MIGYLEGTVRKVAEGYIILLVGGVGYKVAVTGRTLASLRVESLASIWTYLAVRENALDLYGFFSEEELRFFELLLTVSGIGPKSALGIIDIASTETLRAAISQGNASYLTKVSGIGRKTAEKIVLELQDKVGATTASSAPLVASDAEALEALCALGYSAQEARDALRKVPAEIEKAGDRVREVLRLSGSQL